VVLHGTMSGALNSVGKPKPDHCENRSRDRKAVRMSSWKRPNEIGTPYLMSRKHTVIRARQIRKAVRESVDDMNVWEKSKSYHNSRPHKSPHSRKALDPIEPARLDETSSIARAAPFVK
jgi:hypothetical protein